MKSFYILRSNPSLSGNVKCVITSDYNFFLESYNSNNKLENLNYKHVGFKYDEQWCDVITSFFKNTENNTIFEIKNIDDVSNTYTDFKYQFDDIYWSGAKFVEDNFYNEEYEYHAPLYINNEKPTNFLIFRIENLGLINDNVNISNFRTAILDNLKLIKNFSLNTSDLGEWFSNNFSSNLENVPLYVNHNELELSFMYGIDINNSTWNTKYLNLKELYSNNIPIFKSEKYINKLWKDNDLIYPNIVNFKFLFNDTPATPTQLNTYTINRYCGFYVDKMDYIKTISSFTANTLLLPEDISDIENYSKDKCDEIPYIENNIFVQKINNVVYSYYPFIEDYDANKTFRIEYNGNYYEVIRIVNNTTIIGDYLYTIKSTTVLKNGISNILIIELGNDIELLGSTYKNRITIIPTVNIGDYVINNKIELPNYIKFNKTENGQIDVDIIENNLIDNFELSDINIVNIDNNFHIIKKYGNEIPVLNGIYYVHTDYAININNSVNECWINNGIETKESKYYKKINEFSTFDLFRVNFTEIKDFDFDRVNTDYANFEYEEKYDITVNTEPKFYAKDYTDTQINIYTLKNNIAQRIPKLDSNNRPLLLSYMKGELNPITNKEYTDFDLFHTELDNKTWVLFQGVIDGVEWFKYNQIPLTFKRGYYKEDNYIWLLEDDNGVLVGKIDFTDKSNTISVYENLTWGLDGKSIVSDTKESLPVLKSVNPNITDSESHIPVSSEYISSDELWEVENNNLSEIWSKNQSVVKWGALNSIGSHDYPYRLNYSLDIGVYNKEPNIFTDSLAPIRKYQDLDYFYRLDLKDKLKYEYYSLHLNVEKFDIDKYLKFETDYFTELFKSNIVTVNGNNNVYKYSQFYNLNNKSVSETIFKGVKYLISDVSEVVVDNGKINNIITVPNTKYADYKFSILFSRKLSTFTNIYNNGSNNLNNGIDIYLNDYYKNIIVNIYIDSDSVIELSDGVDNVNAETSIIDLWYKDTEFMVNGTPINIFPKIFKLSNFLDIIQNKNYNYSDNMNKLKFIHIYEDMTIKTFDYLTSDFNLDINLPSQLRLKENAYITSAVTDVPLFSIDNTLDNVKFSKYDNVDEYLLNSTNDLNLYNNYPIARSITENKIDKRVSWQLTNSDPFIYRYNSAYIPIFKHVHLFNTYTSLGEGNYKFHDNNLYKFGEISEILISKCNIYSSILKVEEPDKSIYPIVDEYGYDFISRFIFSSNFEQNFYKSYKRINVPTNATNDISGKTIHFDGIKEYLVIPDQPKFNKSVSLIENTDFSNIGDFYIDSNQYYNKYTFNNVLNSTEVNSIKIPVITKHIKLLNIINIDNINLDDLVYYIDFIFHKDISTENAEHQISFKILDKDGVKFTDETYLTYLDPITVINNTESNYMSTIKIDMVVLNRILLGLLTEYYDKNNNIYNKLSNFNFYTLEINIVNTSNALIDIDIVTTLKTKNEINQPIQFNYIDIENNNNLLTDFSIKNNNKELSLDDYYKFNFENVDLYTTEELDTFDTSTANLWREFAGIENARPGRLSRDPYDINKYPIPKNFTGELYCEILDKLSPYTNSTFIGEGSELRDAINNGNYGFNTYFPPLESIDKKFTLSCLYHFLEYSNDNPTNVLNYFYNASAFGGVFAFNKYPFVYRKSIDEPVNYKKIYGKGIEPELNSGMMYLLTKDKTVTSPLCKIKWYSTYKEINLRFDFITTNLLINFDITILNITTKLSINDIINEINEQFVNNGVDKVYYAYKLNDEIVITTNYQYEGSYYNFDIVLYNDIEFKLTLLIKSNSERYVSEYVKPVNILERDNNIYESTVELWVKTDGWYKDNETILYKGSSGDLDIFDESFVDFTYIIHKYKNTNKIAFTTSHILLDKTTQRHTLVSDFEINDGLWHHLAFVVDFNNIEKRILINGNVTKKSKNYLTVNNVSNNEMICLFLENRELFIKGITFPSLGNELDLVNKIRSGNIDTKTNYWIDYINDLIPPVTTDYYWQINNWNVLINEAFKKFKDNFLNLNYQLKTSINNEWNILMCKSLTFNNNFSGFIDELRLWNYARTNDEININSRLVLNPYSYYDYRKQLVGYYRFDNNGLGYITDISKVIKNIKRYYKHQTILEYDKINSFFISSSTTSDGKEHTVILNKSNYWKVGDIVTVSEINYMVTEVISFVNIKIKQSISTTINTGSILTKHNNITNTYNIISFNRTNNIITLTTEFDYSSIFNNGEIIQITLSEIGLINGFVEIDNINATSILINSIGNDVLETISNGYIQKEYREIKTDTVYKYDFITDYYDNININLSDNTDWDNSGALLVGYSDERLLIDTLPSKDEVVEQTTVNIIKNDSVIEKDSSIDKWWLFKNIETKILETLKTNNLVINIDRVGKSWMNYLKNLKK